MTVLCKYNGFLFAEKMQCGYKKLLLLRTFSCGYLGFLYPESTVGLCILMYTCIVCLHVVICNRYILRA